MTYANIAKRVPHIICIVGLLIIAVCLAPESAAQVNYTPGDSIGHDHTAFLFSPFRYQGYRGEDAYKAYVNQPITDSSGQQYGFIDYVDEGTPGTNPGECTVTQFHDLIGNRTEDLGVLTFVGHGGAECIAVEVYDSTAAGETAVIQAYHAYVDTDWAGPDQGDYTPYEVFHTTTAGTERWHVLAITCYFVTNYGHLTQCLAYVGACTSYTLTDDFVAAGARVALGNIDHPTCNIQRDRVTTFFRRMDGHEGRESRPVSQAHQAPPQVMDSLWAYGEENTTLGPAVESTSGPTYLKTGDAITISLDTKCNRTIPPDIECAPCNLDSIQWLDDSTTIRAIVGLRPPNGIDECEFMLLSYSVEGPFNCANLDGNTEPPGGNNAEGPAMDNYVWTMAVAACDCDRWGDVNADSQINPPDIVFMVNYVYMSNDMRVQHENCPLEAGEVNCDGSVDPVDVVLYVDYTYHGRDRFCDDPCYWLEITVE